MKKTVMDILTYVNIQIIHFMKTGDGKRINQFVCCNECNLEVSSITISFMYISQQYGDLFTEYILNLILKISFQIVLTREENHLHGVFLSES